MGTTQSLHYAQVGLRTNAFVSQKPGSADRLVEGERVYRIRSHLTVVGPLHMQRHGAAVQQGQQRKDERLIAKSDKST